MSHAMRATCRLAAGATALILTLGPGLLSADVALSARAADSLQRKILGIRQYAASTLTGARLTPVTESELNSYIRFSLAASLPAGIVDPYVTIIGAGEVQARATVDLDAVRRSKPRGWLDPLAYLSGRLGVTAAGQVTASDGTARLDLREATVGGISVPKPVLQELVTFYSRSPQYPEGIDLDAPFELPARIKDIHVEAGKAVLVQR